MLIFIFYFFKKKIYHSTPAWTFNIQELNVPEKDVEQLLVSLILDNRIDGHIDQVNRLLERGDRSAYFLLFSTRFSWNWTNVSMIWLCTHICLLVQVKGYEEVHRHR